MAFNVILWKCLLKLSSEFPSLWFVDVLYSAALSLAAGKMARINLSQVAFGMILQNHRQLPVSLFSVKRVSLRSWKRVTGRIFKISSNFKGTRLYFKGTVSWDRFQNFWQKFTELVLTMGRDWFFNFLEAPMILKRKKYIYCG
jgi:hypothetical protein